MTITIICLWIIIVAINLIYLYNVKRKNDINMHKINCKNIEKDLNKVFNFKNKKYENLYEN